MPRKEIPTGDRYEVWSVDNPENIHNRWDRLGDYATEDEAWDLISAIADNVRKDRAESGFLSKIMSTESVVMKVTREYVGTQIDYFD